MFLSGASGLLTVGLCIWKTRIPSFELDLELGTDSLPFKSDCCVRLFIVKWGYPDLLTVGPTVMICQVGGRHGYSAALLDGTWRVRVSCQHHCQRVFWEMGYRFPKHSGIWNAPEWLMFYKMKFWEVQEQKKPRYQFELFMFEIYLSSERQSKSDFNSIRIGM